MAVGEKLVSVLRQDSWKVVREGRVDQVEFLTGRTQFRVKIWDAGRDSFITQWFNDIVPANDFLDRVMAENESHLEEEVE